jgi:hypothetical protein
MRAASSRIWSPIPNSDQPSATDDVDHSISGPPAQVNQPVGNPSGSFSKESVTAHEPATPSGNWPNGHSRHMSNQVDGYTKLVTDRVNNGCSIHLVTFLFHQLPGSRVAVLDRMKDEVQRVYSTLLTRVVRRPKTA